MAGLFVTGLVLGTIGYARYFGQEPGWRYPVLDSVYHAFQLTVLEFDILDRPLHWTLHVARFLLPAVAGYAAIKAVVALYSEQLQNLRIRLMVRNHVVVCGLGQRALVLARALVARGHRVVVVEQDEENDMIRAARDAGAFVIVGDATEETVLRRADIARARSLVALCHDDGLNAEIAVRAQALAGRLGRQLSCSCHVDGFRLRDLIERHRVGAQDEPWARVRFFSIYENGAKILIDLEPPFADVPPDSGPHVMVLGVGRMGESLLVRLARAWQAERTAARTALRLTLLDRLAPAKIEYLLSEYPELGGCRLEPAHLEIRSPGFQAGRFLSEPDWLSLTRVYVCLDDDGLGLTAALRVAEQFRKRAREVPVILRTREGHGLAVLLPAVGSPGCPGRCVKAFPLLEHTCTAEAILGQEDRV